MAILNYSCQNELDEVYSCDPKINNWIIDNADKLSEIPRQELVTYNGEMQRAIFRTYSAEKKYELWKEKYSLMISTEEDTKAIDHLKELSSYLSIDLLENPEHNRSVEFEENWISHAKGQLNWSNKRVIFTLTSLMDDIDDYSNETIRNLQLQNTGGQECTCSVDWHDIDHCTLVPFQECGLDWPACTLVSGCGWFWTQTCNGTCIFDPHYE